MTKQEEKRVVEIYGPNYMTTDIPTFIRNRDEKAKPTEDYPLGGMIEPYDIEREKQ